MREWMKVMLEEIARKQAEEKAAREEYERRQRERSGPDTTRGEPKPGDDSAQG